MRGNFKMYIFLMLGKKIKTVYFKTYIFLLEVFAWEESTSFLWFTLPLFFPPSLYPSPLSPSKESWLWTCKPSRAGRGNPKGRQFWVVWREGPTSKWLDGAGCGGYHFLCASLAKFCSQQHSFPVESRSSPPSPQSFSETHFSIPSASWELTLTGRVGHLLNPSTK